MDQAELLVLILRKPDHNRSRHRGTMSSPDRVR
jgi:hypothetical protein